MTNRDTLLSAWKAAHWYPKGKSGRIIASLEMFILRMNQRLAKMRGEGK